LFSCIDVVCVALIWFVDFLLFHYNYPFILNS